MPYRNAICVFPYENVVGFGHFRRDYNIFVQEDVPYHLVRSLFEANEHEEKAREPKATAVTGACGRSGPQVRAAGQGRRSQGGRSQGRGSGPRVRAAGHRAAGQARGSGPRVRAAGHRAAGQGGGSGPRVRAAGHRAAGQGRGSRAPWQPQKSRKAHGGTGRGHGKRSRGRHGWRSRKPTAATGSGHESGHGTGGGHGRRRSASSPGGRGGTGSFP